MRNPIRMRIQIRGSVPADTKQTADNVAYEQHVPEHCYRTPILTAPHTHLFSSTFPLHVCRSEKCSTGTSSFTCIADVVHFTTMSRPESIHHGHVLGAPFRSWFRVMGLGWVWVSVWFWAWSSSSGSGFPNSRQAIYGK